MHVPVAMAKDSVAGRTAIQPKHRELPVDISKHSYTGRTAMQPKHLNYLQSSRETKPTKTGGQKDLLVKKARILTTNAGVQKRYHNQSQSRQVMEKFSALTYRQSLRKISHDAPQQYREQILYITREEVELVVSQYRTAMAVAGRLNPPCGCGKYALIRARCHHVATFVDYKCSRKTAGFCGHDPRLPLNDLSCVYEVERVMLDIDHCDECYQLPKEYELTLNGYPGLLHLLQPDLSGVDTTGAARRRRHTDPTLRLQADRQGSLVAAAPAKEKRRQSDPLPVSSRQAGKALQQFERFDEPFFNYQPRLQEAPKESQPRLVPDGSA
ncbi:hypothetical protein QBC41DRAFT_11761 [Cercophora samala]|uniref:Uncharacterized protein n=1 Tax=Cercophora samala TaxID=330535 RepID=A0AA39Z7K7_9PEZI|nr:hypothetical protein QBC41DRAFT_11761 [Cercophora samala]